MLKHFNVGKAKACVLTISDTSKLNLSVIRLSKTFPDLKLIARIKDPNHQRRLESKFGKESCNRSCLFNIFHLDIFLFRYS